MIKVRSWGKIVPFTYVPSDLRTVERKTRHPKIHPRSPHMMQTIGLADSSQVIGYRWLVTQEAAFSATCGPEFLLKTWLELGPQQKIPIFFAWLVENKKSPPFPKKKTRKGELTLGKKRPPRPNPPAEAQGMGLVLQVRQARRAAPRLRKDTAPHRGRL